VGLSEGRSDKAAIALEQPHRGTTATPLASAILKRRHGQGAVPSRLLCLCPLKPMLSPPFLATVVVPSP